MNELQAVQTFLSRAMLADTRLSLANVVAWLDPMYLAGDPEEDLAYADYGEENDLRVTLNVCRRCFPGVYSGATQLIWQDTDDITLSRYLCQGINAALVTHLDHIEQVKYGPPVEGRGVCLEDIEFYEAYPDLVAIVADFGLTAGVKFPDVERARNVAGILIHSLKATGSETLQDIAHLLTWLFSLSGNTLVDMTMDEIWDSGLEMPDWTPDDVAFVNEMTLEAMSILADATDGQEALEADPELRAALHKNIQLVYEALKKQGRKRKPHDGRAVCQHLRWPDLP